MSKGLALTDLTETEARVAALVAQGKSMREVATIIGWKTHSVKVFLSSKVYKRIGVHSQLELMRWWIDYVEQRGDCGRCLLKQAHLVSIEPTS